MKKPIKVVLIILSVLCVISIIGYVGVNWAFNKYVMSPFISMQVEKTPPSSPLPTNSMQPTQTDKPKEELSTSQIASKVQQSSDLMSILEGMVSPGDKSRVMAILMSCFSTDELNEFRKWAKDGLSAKERSEIISQLRSRLSSEKKAEILRIFDKYADNMLPYVQ